MGGKIVWIPFSFLLPHLTKLSSTCPNVLTFFSFFRKIWENFVEICCKNNSFFGLSWQDLKSLLLAVELKKKYKLNPLAPEFIPRSLQTEPYLQFLGAPLTRPPPGIQQTNSNMAVPCNSNVPGRVYTYDNIRYQLPQKNVMDPTLVPPAPMIPTPNMPASAKWSQPPPPLPPLNHINPPLNSVPLKPTTPTVNATQLRTPPGFPPLQIPSSSIIYPPIPQTYSNVYQPINQFSPPSAPYVSSAGRSSLTPETSIPLQLTLIPLSQYIRSQQPTAYSLSGTKTFNPPIVTLGNAICAPAVNLPNGYKTNIVNDVYVQTNQNTVKYQDYPGYTVPQNVAPVPQNVPPNIHVSAEIVPLTYYWHSSPESLIEPIRSVQQVETDLKSILPPNVTLSEMLQNSSLQKQWLSYLMDSKQIQTAQL